MTQFKKKLLSVQWHVTMRTRLESPLQSFGINNHNQRTRQPSEILSKAFRKPCPLMVMISSGKLFQLKLATAQYRQLSDIGSVTPNIILQILLHVKTWLIFRAARNPSLCSGFIHTSLIRQQPQYQSVINVQPTTHSWRESTKGSLQEVNLGRAQYCCSEAIPTKVL